MLTRRHYVKIAQAIAQLPPSDHKQRLILEIVTVLSNDNPLFDRNKFICACHFKLSKDWIR